MQATSTAPLLTRLNWYWTCQLAGWSAILLFTLAAYGQYIGKPGVLATCIWAAASGLLVSHAWRALIKRRGWGLGRHAWKLAAGTEQVRVPPMALQTLVENAVKYGVELNSDGSDIEISTRRENGRVRIEIANTGALRQFSNSTQVGLSNARKRLIRAVGPDASLELAERSGWVRATPSLPEAA